MEQARGGRSGQRERIVIRGAYVLTCDGADRVSPSGDIVIEEGRITAVGQVADEAVVRGARVIEGRDRLVAPGLINAHMHSTSTLLKGTADHLSHPAFMWRKQADTAGRTPREIYISALLGCLEMLQTGTTTCLDHFPDQRFGLAEVDAVAQAYVDAGMRAILGLRVFDEAFADILPTGTVPPDLHEALRHHGPQRGWPLGDIRGVMEDAIRRWHGRDERLAVFPSPSAPLRCSDPLLALCQELAERYDTGIHTHLLETQVQAGLAQQRYGVTQVQHLQRLGLLTPRLSCAHTIWLDEDDIGRLADAQAVVVHNPGSNLKLGTGLAPIPTMLARGVTVALGTDGVSTNDSPDLHRAMHLAAVLHRPHEPQRARWVSAREALRMATQGGATALRLAGQIGAIAVGMRADLVLYDLTAPPWVPFNDPIQHLVHVEDGRTVDTVLIDGRVVVAQGTVTTIDAAALLAEARPMLAAIRARNAAVDQVARRVAALP
jgi:cytosine/adenosine deaminase-related metal-dependent hydrolase